ncbi:MAG: hypothetical protein ICV73_22085 [Acetobacteraceae bacterium]|nr:hypothetical protein [Acetobacteraceae bacterium]
MEPPATFEIVWIVASRTPWWVYALFAFLLYLGLRRLRPKRNRLWVAALAPGGFLLWSAVAAAALTRAEPAGLVAATWGTGFVLGAASAPVRLVPRPVQVERGVFLFAASWVPLIAYMLIFWIRYGLEVWSEFVPRLDGRLAFAGLALSALTAGRTVGDFLPLVRATAGRWAGAR